MLMSSSPRSIASATPCGSSPVSTIALPMYHAAPTGSMELAIRWSTTTLGMGTSISFTPSIPSRRQTARSTVTVVCWSIKSCVSLAMFAADWRALSTNSPFKLSLLCIDLPPDKSKPCGRGLTLPQSNGSSLIICSRSSACRRNDPYGAAWWVQDTSAQRPVQGLQHRSAGQPCACLRKRRNGTRSCKPRARYRW